MVQIRFIAFDGRQYDVDAPAESSLMEAARDNDVPGIDADCGGVCACATCHVFIEPQWFDLLGERGEGEGDMLELAEDIRPTSRLACQIKLSDALDGIEVRLPEYQR